MTTENDYTMTSDERALLCRVFAGRSTMPSELVPAVETILAARQARLLNLLDTTERNARGNNHLSRLSTWQVREALTYPPADGIGHLHTQVAPNPSNGDRIDCACGYAAEFVVLDDGRPGEWVDVSTSPASWSESSQDVARPHWADEDVVTPPGTTAGGDPS